MKLSYEREELGDEKMRDWGKDRQIERGIIRKLIGNDMK